MKKYKMRFFDFEVTPHWWLCVFGDLPDDISNVSSNIKSTFTSVNSDMPNARDLLLNQMRNEDYVLLGYNIKNYDLPIANCIYQGFSPEEIKIVSDIIINPSLAYSTKEHLRLLPFARKKLSKVVYQDLIDDVTDKQKISLKEIEAVLGINVLESDVDFNKEQLTKEDKNILDYYCRQDVYAAMQFYIKVVHSYTVNQLHLGEHFNIAPEICHKSTNAALVGLALGAKPKTFLDKDKDIIQLPDKIKQYCYNNLPNKIVDTILESKEGFKVNLFDNEVSFGNGGLHSVYQGNFKTPPCLYIESNEEYVIVLIDAGSYYPSEMIQFNLLSRAVENPQVFIDIYNERMEIKHKENKTAEDQAAQLADKLVLNTTFGASGNKYLALYDPYMCSKVCRVGQIFLGALANKIYKTINNVKIIQCNTDGICCYLPVKELDNLQKLMNEWSDISGIKMDRDDIVKIWQRDVNNYLAIINENGKLKIKNKGAWLKDNPIRPGYVTLAALDAPACSKAVIDYLINGKDIVESLVNNHNLYDFMIACVKGPTFSYMIHRMANGDEIKLRRANRVIATKDKQYGMLYKVKKRLDKISYNQVPSIPEHCKLMNKDVNEYDFNEVRKDLDYMYYIEKCNDLLDMQWIELNGTNISITDKFDYFNH